MFEEKKLMVVAELGLVAEATEMVVVVVVKQPCDTHPPINPPW